MRIAEQHFATADTTDAFKVLVIKINAHVCVEDVSGPVADDANDCACGEDGSDGFEDLTLKFETQAIAEAIGEVNHGDELMLYISGVLDDGQVIEGSFLAEVSWGEVDGAADSTDAVA